MRITLLSLFVALITFASCNQHGDKKDNLTSSKLSGSDREEILSTFMNTQEAWNRGNLEEFMSGYWNSEKLVFTGVGGPTYGYKATLDRYKKGYPDSKAMGILKFTVIDLYQIDTNSAIMIGKFYLSRNISDVAGHFTLIWQKIDGCWLIISDHSSGQALQ